MAQFIREFCTDDVVYGCQPVRRLHDRYVHFKHRLASANIRLAAHVAKRFRHHSLSYADLLQEAVCGLMQAIDRFDVSHGTRLATYATDRKSTRLNSSHANISYAVFCLKKKKTSHPQASGTL